MPRPVAVFLLLFLTAIWGFAFVFQKTGMEHVGPFTFMAVRFLLGGVALLPMVAFELHRKPAARARFDRTSLGLTLLLSAVLAIAAALQQVGLITASVTNGGFLTALYVLFVPLLGFLFLRTRPHPAVYVGVPAALFGVFLLNGGKLDAFAIGDGLMVAGALFWGAHVLLVGLVSLRTGLPVTISVASFLFVGVCCTGIAFAVETPDPAAIADAWQDIAFAGLLSTAVAYTLQAIAQPYVPSANAAIILSSESLFAALGGALLLGERLPPVGYAGAALIFVAILMVEAVPALRQRRAASNGLT